MSPAQKYYIAVVVLLVIIVMVVVPSKNKSGFRGSMGRYGKHGVQGYPFPTMMECMAADDLLGAKFSNFNMCTWV